MSSRILAASARAVPRAVPAVRAARTFQTSATLRDAVATPLPARKPVGAFRGGLLGFFAGSSLAGAGVYSYLVKEYKLSNELLTEDIYRRRRREGRRMPFLPVESHPELERRLSPVPVLQGVFPSCPFTYDLYAEDHDADLFVSSIQALQAAVQRVTVYVQTLEEKMDALERKRK
ncbi:hypothetical protein VdG2_07167 [Verticillium dahliae VDG2]|nr:hypothetical protein VdG2_07167 [Verticillium dahliae VDG2]